MQAYGRPPTFIGSSALVAAAMDEDNTGRLEMDAGAGAISPSAAAIEIRPVSKLTGVVDVGNILIAIFALEQWRLPPVDPKAEDDNDTPGESETPRLPRDVIRTIIFDHLYDFYAEAEVTAMQVMKRAAFAQGARCFEFRYGIEPNLMYEGIRADHGKKPTQIIADPNIDTKFQIAEGLNRDRRKPIRQLLNPHLRIQGRDDLVFIPLQMEHQNFRRIEIIDCPNLKALPESWLKLEEKELRYFKIENCPKLVLSPEMKAMYARIDAKYLADEKKLAKILLPILCAVTLVLVLFLVYGIPALDQDNTNPSK